MRSDRPREGWFERLMRWAEGGEPDLSQEVAEDPERAEFLEYLQYLESHTYMEFGAYRLMRLKERAGRGELPRVPAGHGEEKPAVRPAGRRRHRPGSLRRMVRLYRLLSVGVAAVMMAVLAWVSLELPAFGDPAAPAVNEVSGRYLERGTEETGAVNAVAGLILDYRAFDTFGESTVLFAATMSVVLLMRRPARQEEREAPADLILRQTGRVILPAILMFGVYVVLNGHLSPGGGFSGGTVLGCGLILCSLVLGRERMAELLPERRLTLWSVVCLLAYGGMKGYSFFTGANHLGWDVPKGTPGNILSAGFILPLNICVGVIVACTMYTFYRLFSEGREGA